MIECPSARTAVMLTHCAVVSGSPGILFHEFHECHLSKNFKHNMLRAKLLDNEWENGICALYGENMKGITGRFPDQGGRFLLD